MKKNLMFYVCSLAFAGSLASCSGSSDEVDIPTEVTGPITLTADKSVIEANGEDMVTFIVKDANGIDLTANEEYKKEIYFQDVTTDTYLERKTNTFKAVVNGTHSFKAYYKDWVSEPLEIKVQNRKNYEVFYRKIAVFKMTGTWCVNCPRMTAGLHAVEEEMPGRMVRMGFHASSSAAADPFHLNETGKIMSAFGASGFPTCIYDLIDMSSNSGKTVIKELFNEHMMKYPATCGIKINSAYNAATGKITVNASLKSNKGGTYDLVYALVQDGLTAQDAAEDVYDYTVMGISPNYMKMSDAKFTVAADKEHNAAEYTIEAKGLDASKARVVIYALTRVDGKDRVDNITECPINGSVDYKYND